MVNTQLQAIRPLEFGKSFDPKDTLCWNCHDRERQMVFPNYGGSFLGIYCQKCSSVGRVLQRLEDEK